MMKKLFKGIDLYLVVIIAGGVWAFVHYGAQIGWGFAAILALVLIVGFGFAIRLMRYVPPCLMWWR